MTALVNREPDFINPEGVRWWKENSVLDSHAKRSLGPQASVWIVQTSEQFELGISEYLLLDGQQPIANSSSLEGMAVKIDVEELIRRP